MLGRGPDGDLLLTEISDHRVRLHGIVIDHREGEVVLEDLIRLCKTILDVSFFHTLMAANIVAQVLMDPRRSLPQGCLQTHNHRQLFVINPDQREGLFSRRLIFCRHCSYRLSHIVDLLNSDDRTSTVVRIEV